MPNTGDTFEGDHSPYRAMLGRMIRAYGRRVANASPEDLAEFLTIKTDVDEALSAAVAGLRAQGHSWASIARGIGMSRQAAFKRWGQADDDDPEIDAAIAEAELAISTALARKAQREIEAEVEADALLWHSGVLSIECQTCKGTDGRHYASCPIVAIVREAAAD